MTEYSWALIRDQAIHTWGTIPQGQLEADILEIFEQTPALVVATIDKTTVAYKAGRITSPWAILRLELQKAVHPDRTPTVTDTAAKERAIARAEAWIRTTGIHYPTENEIIAHLFGVETQTAPLDYLEQLEHDTIGRPGRPLYIGLLQASIRRTREHGTQTIPDTGTGILAHYRTTATRDRMTALWRELRPQGEQLEREELIRAEAWKKSHADARATQHGAAAPPIADGAAQ
jgi:hypothetical protein